MIPFFEQPVLRLGPVSIHAFGVLIAVAMLIGLHLASRRARRHGLDSDVTSDMLVWALAFGLAGAHLFAVLAYTPSRVTEDPWLLLRFWEELSSFGGMIGGLVGIWVYFQWRRPGLPPSVRWAQIDVVAFMLPFAWAVGRLGCLFAHDHPGYVTTFFLARSLKSPPAREFIAQVYAAAGLEGALPHPSRLAEMGFHDLGGYEFLYLSLVVAPAFLWLDRQPRPQRFWVAAFLLLYTSVRFGIDFLRVSDVRYAGLTPGQYAALGGLVAGVGLLMSVNRARDAGLACT